MNSPFLALLLIINLLACPLRCLSCETTAAAGEERAAETCACCSHCDQAPLSAPPAPCGDECNCQSCICEGAVIQTETELPDTDLLICWEQPTSAPVACSTGQDLVLTRHGFACTGQLCCGRDVRVAHQSWLI